MNSTMTSVKSTSESSSYNESPFLSRSRTSSFSVNDVPSHSDLQIFSQQRIILTSRFDRFEEELGAPINIYHEHSGHLEEDKKARTDLNTDILDDDLYCPVQHQEISDNSTPRGLNLGKFVSFLPRFSFSTNNNFGGAVEPTNTDKWCYDMFNTNNMFGNFDGINGINGINGVAGVACK